MCQYDKTEEMEMPTPCQKCGEWFDLNDGRSSEKWFPDTVICEKCADEERKEIDSDEEIQDLKNSIDDAVVTIKEARNRLSEMGINIPIWIKTPLY